MSDHECPTCGDVLPSEHGLKIHHSKIHNTRLDDVEMVCSQCGGEYDRPPSRAGRFCSPECHHEWMADDKPGGDVDCPTCEQSFHTRRGMKIHHNRVHGEALERAVVSHECEICDSTFTRPESCTAPARCCSPECVGELLSEEYSGKDSWQWQGGVFPYGPGWNDKKKEAVRERDGRECQHCGRTEKDHLEKFGKKHHVHHIVPAREFDVPEERNAMENLITLCQGECHTTWEQMAPLRPDTSSAVAD